MTASEPCLRTVRKPDCGRHREALTRQGPRRVTSRSPDTLATSSLEASALLWLIIDLEFGSRAGDEDDQQLRRSCPAGVFREQVVRARRLDPVLALAVGMHWLARELAAHSALEHVGVNERRAVPVRRRACIGREEYDLRGERLALDVRQWLFQQGRCCLRGVLERRRT